MVIVLYKNYFLLQANYMANLLSIDTPDKYLYRLATHTKFQKTYHIPNNQTFLLSTLYYKAKFQLSETFQLFEEAATNLFKYYLV